MVMELRPRCVDLLHRVVATCLRLVLHCLLHLLMVYNRGV